MNNDSDLSHITKQIQKNMAEIKASRNQAQRQWNIANQKSGSDNAGYYEKEATRSELRADELESEIDQLETAKARIEQRITELEAQRSKISSAHQEHIADIDRQITQLRGSVTML
ncbi:MAG: hypothetical protein ACREGE_01760 [Candidatus Microsaccharimonas sp.]